MSEDQFFSFYSFLLEPMVDLEPGKSSHWVSSNGAHQNTPQDLGELNTEVLPILLL